LLARHATLTLIPLAAVGFGAKRDDCIGLSALGWGKSTCGTVGLEYVDVRGGNV